MGRLSKYIWLVLATPLVLLVWFIEHVVERNIDQKLNEEE